MSVLVFTGLIVASWAAAKDVINDVVAASGFGEPMTDLPQDEEQREQLQVVREVLLVENSRIFAGQKQNARVEKLAFAKNNVRLTFRRNEHGSLQLEVEAIGITHAAARKIGREMIGRLAKKYAYDRLLAEMNVRGMHVMHEEIEDDQTIKLFVRNGNIMAKEEFEIEIRPDGKISVRTVGIKGEACVDAAKQFLEMLEGKLVSEEKTSEYYENESTSNTEVQNWNRWE